MFLTVGSGYLARAGMHYSDAAENDVETQQFSACSSCMNNDQIVSSYVESLQGKMQSSLQDMILHAGVGIALISMGAGFSAVYMKWYRNVQPIL